MQQMTKKHIYGVFLLDPGIPGVRSMGPGPRCHSLTHCLFAELTDVSLVDEDTNSILAYKSHRAIPGKLETQVVPPGDQIYI